MADAGVYLAVSRNDEALPNIVHSAIYLNSEEGQREAAAHAQRLFLSAKGRIPFCVVEIHHYPRTPISEAGELNVD